MAKSQYTSGHLTVATALAEVARVMNWDPADTTVITQIDTALTAAGNAAATWEGRGWWWSKKTGTFRTKIWTLSNAVRDTGTTTFTTTAVHGLGVGQYVVVDGCTDSTLDGLWRVATVPSTTTFTVEHEGDDIASDDGDGTVYVVSYPIRQVNGQLMGDCYSILRMGLDTDFWLAQVSKDRWDSLLLTTSNTSGDPNCYCIFEDIYAAYAGTPVYTRELYVGVWPAPSDNETVITVPYVRAHGGVVTNSSTGSEDAALIVPREFQHGVYIDGAIYLLKRQTQDQSSLNESEAFRAVMSRMGEAENMHFNGKMHDVFPDMQRAGFPHNKSVFETSDGYLIMNDPTI